MFDAPFFLCLEPRPVSQHIERRCTYCNIELIKSHFSIESGPHLTIRK